MALEAEWREKPAALLVLTALDPGRLEEPLRERVRAAILFADDKLALEPDRGGAYHLVNAMAAIKALRGGLEDMTRLLARHAARCAA